MKINYITAVLFRNSSRQESFTFCDSILYSPYFEMSVLAATGGNARIAFGKHAHFTHFRFSRSLRDTNKLISEIVVVLALIFLKV